MTLDIRLEFESPPPTTTPPALHVIKQVRKWGDPIAVDAMGADTARLNDGKGAGNFQAIQLSTAASGRAWFGAVSQYQALGDIDGEYYNYLESLQYEQPDAGQYGTVKAIMNWLVNHDGSGKRPYFIKNGKFVFGTIAFGGQKIEIESLGGRPVEYRFVTKFPSHETDSENELFYCVEGIRKSELNAGYTYQTHPWKIQRATAANNKPVPNTYTDKPRDTEIFHPVWSWRDWPANERDGKLYIAARLLES